MDFGIAGVAAITVIAYAVGQAMRALGRLDRWIPSGGGGTVYHAGLPGGGRHHRRRHRRGRQQVRPVSCTRKGTLQ